MIPALVRRSSRRIASPARRGRGGRLPRGARPT